MSNSKINSQTKCKNTAKTKQYRYGTCTPGISNTTAGACANVTKSMDYWKVKNSWGTKFGVDGYFYLARGVHEAGCGTASMLLTNPSYPVMAK